MRELARDVDLCIVLGGDGTILTALRHYAGTDVPVFAVNYGEVGFLATIDPDGIASDFERAFAGEFETLGLPTITVGRPEGQWTAINDISVHRKPGLRVADLAYGLAGEEIGRVRCDGLVVASPQGSTGYNLANGGPVLAWGVRGYVVSFIAPHSLTARALVVRPRRPAHDQQRAPARSPSRSTSTAGRRASSRRGRTSTSSSAAPSACSPSCRARASTTGCGSGSGGWLADVGSGRAWPVGGAWRGRWLGAVTAWLGTGGGGVAGDVGTNTSAPAAGDPRRCRRISTATSGSPCRMAASRDVAVLAGQPATPFPRTSPCRYGARARSRRHRRLPTADQRRKRRANRPPHAHPDVDRRCRR